MSKPHKCPVCNGTALVSIPPGIAGDQDIFTTSETGPWPCRACINGVLWEMDPVYVPGFSMVSPCDHRWISDTAGTRCAKCGENATTLVYTPTKANQT